MSRSQIKVDLKSTGDLERMLHAPLDALDREAIERELRQRGQAIAPSGPAPKEQGTLF